MGGFFSMFFSQPWRMLNKEEDLDFVKSYQPQNKEVKHLRILLHGPVGGGKSSFVNSVESVLRGRVTSNALTDAATKTSFTKKYKTYKIHRDSEKTYPFIFCDTMGFEREASGGVSVNDILLTLKGHVKDGYEFDPNCPLTANCTDYNSSPTLEDRFHVLVSVVPTNNASLMSDEVVKKMREVRLAANAMEIPQLAVLTKVDEAHPDVKKNINEVYKNDHLKEKVEKFSALLGLPINCIFLVKNYHSEIRTNDDMDALILCALRQMITFGEDFLNNL